LQVGAFIIKVKNAHPDTLKRLIIRNVLFNVGFDERINVNAIPTAPRNPPYVNAPTYFHFKPYPKFFNFGMKIDIAKNLANVIQKYK
jgi:hypothetical protein